MNPCAFRLPAGIFYCEASARLVFLDLRRDRYLCLTEDGERCFRRLIAGTPLVSDEPELAQLAEDGLLARSSESVSPLPCVPPMAPTRSLVDSNGRPAARRVAHAAWRLALSRATFGLQPLHLSLEHLAARKKRVVDETEDAEAAAAEVAHAFERTGLWLAPLDQCLPRSLAIAHALIDLNVRANLVIGVKLRPFAAHCWVQRGETLINDAIDHARTLTPIMVV